MTGTSHRLSSFRPSPTERHRLGVAVSGRGRYGPGGGRRIRQWRQDLSGTLLSALDAARQNLIDGPGDLYAARMPAFGRMRGGSQLALRCHPGDLFPGRWARAVPTYGTLRTTLPRAPGDMTAAWAALAFRSGKLGPTTGTSVR